ncbi:MAG: hypothetical protein JST30_02930 [Armatimonadetes bacterium]|nr:hypothetical protein [Armatimonadota bacterium]
MRNVLPVVVFAGLALVAGCGPKDKGVVYRAPDDASYSAAPDDPDTELADQLRRGAVQMTGASESIEAALVAAREYLKQADGDLASAAQDLVDFLDSAGESVSEAAGDPPTVDDVKKDFVKTDDERKKRIETGNDAFRDLEQALGVVTALQDQVAGLEKLHDLVTLAMDDTGDAVEAFGGTVESEADQEKDGGPSSER